MVCPQPGQKLRQSGSEASGRDLGVFNRDELTAGIEVGPAVHIRRLNSQPGQDRCHLGAVLGAMVDGLDEEQRHGHPPSADRVVSGDFDLTILVGRQRGLLEL